MLTKLTIKNFVLIRDLQMSPANGLTIITGETGAGKSIMLGAVGLLMGNRADTKTLLNSEEKCVIEGVFDIKEYNLKAIFDENDIDYDHQTIIRREILPSGKSRAFVNDTPARLEFLRELSAGLLDVHSQNETFDLGQSFYQVKLLDAYAGNEALKTSYRTAYRVYAQAEKDYQVLLAEADSIRKDQDYNQFLYQELEALSLEEGEQEVLEQELEVLEHAEEIKSTLSHSSEALSNSEGAILATMADVSSSLKKISGFSKELEELSERLNSNLIDLQDLVTEIDRENDNLEFDPKRQEEVSSRLSEIFRLQQKHKVYSVQDLIALMNDLSSKLHTAMNLEDDLEASRKHVEKSLRDTIALGNQLSESRKKVAGKLGQEICQILRELSIPDARFVVNFEECPPNENGIDQIEFSFSANKGVHPESLRKVASGGEFSRLMFAVKYIMAGKTSLPTIIFDEIDNGISGEVARKLGHLMKDMGQRHQIVAITHLPQIAARGKQHYFVYKQTGKEATTSYIRELEKEERIDEIAKMIAGDNPSDSALESARELVKE